MILAFLLMGLVPAPAQAAAPMQVCEVRAGAWCLVRSGVRFDAKTIDNDRRIWRLFGPPLGASSINIIESRACSSAIADGPSRSEGLGKSKIDGSRKYTIRAVMNVAATCELYIEIDTKGDRPDEIAYEFAMSGVRACSDRQSAGVTLSSISDKGEP